VADAFEILATLRRAGGRQPTQNRVGSAVGPGDCSGRVPAVLGGTFMPDFREGHFVMQVSSSVTGTSLDEMVNLGERISKEVLALPYVQSIEQQVGRAELSEDTWVRIAANFTWS